MGLWQRPESPPLLTSCPAHVWSSAFWQAAVTTALTKINKNDRRPYRDRGVHRVEGEVEPSFLPCSLVSGAGALSSDHWSMLGPLRAPSALLFWSLSERVEWLGTGSTCPGDLCIASWAGLACWSWCCRAGFGAGLGVAARQARYFLIWHLPPPHLPLQTGQISLCRAACY